MSKRGDKEYLKDILIACKNIIEYSVGYDFNMFMDDRKTQDAILRNIEIIGEAIKNLSDEIKKKYPKVEWREIARTRDKLIHSYFGVDLDVVWDIITLDIPRLRQQIEEIIKKEGWDNPRSRYLTRSNRDANEN